MPEGPKPHQTYSHHLLEVVNQGEGCAIAAGLLNDGLRTSDTALIFFAAQGMLSAVAAVSRLLHPPRNRPRYRARAEALSELLPNTARDPIIASRRARDRFEHFEEYLDDYLADDENIVSVDQYVFGVPLHEMIYIADAPLTTALRGFRLDTMNIHMLDWSVNAQQLMDSAQNAAAEARRALDA